MRISGNMLDRVVIYYFPRFLLSCIIFSFSKNGNIDHTTPYRLMVLMGFLVVYCLIDWISIMKWKPTELHSSDGLLFSGKMAFVPKEIVSIEVIRNKLGVRLVVIETQSSSTTEKIVVMDKPNWFWESKNEYNSVTIGKIIATFPELQSVVRAH